MSDIYITDTHCHLDYLDKTVDQVILDAESSRVKHFMTIAVEEKQWGKILKIADHKNIDCALGIHPCDVANAKEGWEARLLEIAKDPRVVAIGETGLDNYHDPNQKELQRKAFEAHLYIAKSTQKPLVIHMREATDEVLSFLTSQGGCHGILHCFSEDYEIAKKAIDLGLMISFSGIVTFKNAKAVQEAAQKIPLDSMLVETDAPFLAPQPFRGKTNYPKYTRYVVEKIAELRGITWEEVAEQTTKNFFSITGR